MKFIFFLFVCAISLFFNPSEEPAYSYVEDHKDLAVIEMYRTGIPASITLAQGMHESGLGKSDLAIHANNHFGIKCKSYWQGKTYAHKDDDYDADGNLIKSCFRAYETVIDSYIDHSNFLATTEHYQPCFQFDKTDYKNWAYSLKSCGYATDKSYAYKLIDKIEKYQLYIYDSYTNPLEIHK